MDIAAVVKAECGAFRGIAVSWYRSVVVPWYRGIAVRYHMPFGLSAADFEFLKNWRLAAIWWIMVLAELAAWRKEDKVLGDFGILWRVANKILREEN